MSIPHTHYDNLKVARNAPDAVIRAAYKVLMQNYHPDKFEGTEQEALRIAKLIKQSYDVLIDPVKRAEHDRWIAGQEAKAKQQSKNTGVGQSGEANQQHHQKQKTQHEYTPPSEPNYSNGSTSAQSSTPADNTLKKSNKWGSIWPMILGVASVKLFGAASGLVTLGAFYWLRPKLGTWGAVAVSGILGTVVAFGLTYWVGTAPMQLVQKPTPTPTPTQSTQAIPSSANSPQDMFDRANELYNQKKYVEAFTLYQNLAQYSGAKIKLGEMYERGNGVIKDYKQALYWYGEAEKRGDENALDAGAHVTALNKLISYQAQTTPPAQTQTQARIEAKAQARLDAQAQAQAHERFEAQAQAQARLEAQTQALAQELAQAKAAQVKAAADKLGVIRPDGGIVFHVDNSGSHGLEAKAADETDLLDWTGAIDAAKDYGSGWRLPTSDELQLLYKQKAVVGGFAAGNYWSSTKSANRTVWRQNFGDGGTHYHPIDDELRVRAVRAF